jgi:hypothetical protein
VGPVAMATRIFRCQSTEQRLLAKFFSLGKEQYLNIKRQGVYSGITYLTGRMCKGTFSYKAFDGASSTGY